MKIQVGDKLTASVKNVADNIVSVDFTLEETQLGFICRHGETELNADGKFRSWVDVPLNDKGRTQAYGMATFLKSYPVQIKRIVSSPLKRAMETAAVLSMILNIPVEVDPMLLPWNLGKLAGKDKKENHDKLKEHVTNPNIPVEGGESLNFFRGRQMMIFSELLEWASENGPVCIVAHTSNAIAADDAINGYFRHPEESEVVAPGGALSISVTDRVKVRPVFGQVVEGEFGH